jgi:hypothetical protein
LVVEVRVFLRRRSNLGETVRERERERDRASGVYVKNGDFVFIFRYFVVYAFFNVFGCTIWGIFYYKIPDCSISEMFE